MREHVILNYQDRPAKLLLWETSSVLTVCGSFVAGVLFISPWVGLITGLSAGLAIRWYKKRFGKGSLIGLKYWILPHDKRRYPLTPPSYIREYIG